MIENKPIALVTGAPGSGKTALLVNYLVQAEKEGRPIFQNGIPELKLTHFPVPSPDKWIELREDPDTGRQLPYFTFPERSIVVLSEAQRLFPTRPTGSKKPDEVAAFETCRHTGVTFVLDTQHPDFIDSHVRKLVGQHVHLLDHGVLGRWQYEWPYVGNPDNFKSAPSKKKYKLPKKVFSLYKSSSLHIKRNYNIPPALVVLIVALIALAYGGYLVYGTLSKKIAPEAVKPIEIGQMSGRSEPSAAIQTPKTAADFLVEFSPMVPGRPETAPAYDALRVVKNMPVVAGCIQTQTRCTCQNQQGLDAGLDNMQCKQWLANPPFDAYRDRPLLAETRSKADEEVNRNQKQRPPDQVVSPVVASVPASAPATL